MEAYRYIDIDILLIFTTLNHRYMAWKCHSVLKYSALYDTFSITKNDNSDESDDEVSLM